MADYPGDRYVSFEAFEAMANAIRDEHKRPAVHERADVVEYIARENAGWDEWCRQIVAMGKTIAEAYDTVPVPAEGWGNFPGSDFRNRHQWAILKLYPPEDE